MTKEQIYQNILKKKSFLCVGLDTDIKKLPTGIEPSVKGILEFNRQIISATLPYSISYKLNTAFYECYGSEGWKIMLETVDFIKKSDDSIFVIADAKRGDIGNTSKMYAEAFLSNTGFDAITVAPYMGRDSVAPFLEIKDKWVILLALTSNQGSNDFQTLRLNSGEYLFENVLQKSSQWADSEQMMYVVGATQPEYVENIRKIVPNHFFLVPGVGAQGGNLESIFQSGHNSSCGIIVNSSRSIIFASKESDFADAAKFASQQLQIEMSALLKKYNLL